MKKLSWIQVQVKIFSVPWKLMMVEEHRQNQHYRGD
jgi:hypothetical protein